MSAETAETDAGRRRFPDEGDILGPSEAMRASMDCYAHAVSSRETLDRLAGLEPRTLACMHGGAWRGDGGGLLRALGGILEREQQARADQGGTGRR
jgi:hypothetical protein